MHFCTWETFIRFEMRTCTWRSELVDGNRRAAVRVRPGPLLHVVPVPPGGALLCRGPSSRDCTACTPEQRGRARLPPPLPLPCAPGRAHARSAWRLSCWVIKSAVAWNPGHPEGLEWEEPWEQVRERRLPTRGSETSPEPGPLCCAAPRGASRGVPSLEWVILPMLRIILASLLFTPTFITLLSA